MWGTNSGPQTIKHSVCLLQFPTYTHCVSLHNMCNPCLCPCPICNTWIYLFALPSICLYKLSLTKFTFRDFVYENTWAWDSQELDLREVTWTARKRRHSTQARPDPMMRGKEKNGWRPMSAPYKSNTAAAKSLQSCLTLWDPIDGSPPGSSVPGILQARILEWVAISFSNACMHAMQPMDSSPPGSSVHRIL